MMAPTPRPRRARTSDLSWCSTARASAPSASMPRVARYATKQEADAAVAKVKDGFVLPPHNLGRNGAELMLTLTRSSSSISVG
jgi:hypothetical protein